MLRKPHLLALVATVIATASAASAQTLPPAPTITPITATNLQLVKVNTMNTNPNLAAYTGSGTVTIGGVSKTVLVTLATQAIVNADGIGVVNGALNMIDRTSGLMLTGRLLGTITDKAVAPIITVEGAQRVRTATTFTPPQMLRGNVTVKPVTVLGIQGATVTLDGVLVSMPAMTMGGMGGMGG